MKPASFLIPALLVLVVVSCSKNNSSSKPSLSIQSMNTTVEPGGILDVKLKFTNGGNLSGANFLAIRVRLNTIPLPSVITPSGSDTVITTIPDFPGQQSGVFDYTMPYQGYLTTGNTTNDTLMFKFAAITNSGVSSDTISSSPVIIVNQ
jgi:hypothetical protein